MRLHLEALNVVLMAAPWPEGVSMRRLPWVLAMASLLCGCYAATRVSSNRSYLSDGYKVEGPHGRFTHSVEENRNEMVIGYGFEEKTLIDENCDGTLDEIRYRGSRFRIEDADSDPTIPELFARAAAEYNQYYDRMQVHEVHRKWDHWKAVGVAQEMGYFEK